MQRRSALGFLLFALAATAAYSHDDATLDRTPAPHGGRIRMAGRYHLELVLEPERLRVFFTSHAGKAVAAPAGPIHAKITSGGRERIVRLEPIGEHAVGASGRFPIAPDTAIDVVVERGDAPPLVVRFKPRSVRDVPARLPRHPH